MPKIAVIDDYAGRPDDVLPYAQFQKDPTDAVEERFADADERDLSAIVYTSGTTGLPKGAMLDNLALCAQVDALDVFSTSVQRIRRCRSCRSAMRSSGVGHSSCCCMAR